MISALEPTSESWVVYIHDNKYSVKNNNYYTTVVYSFRVSPDMIYPIQEKSGLKGLRTYLLKNLVKADQIKRYENSPKNLFLGNWSYSQLDSIEYPLSNGEISL
jgi:hypothetical protein